MKSPLLFSGSSHKQLAEEISTLSGIPLGKVSLYAFPDGETGVEILEDVRDRVVFVLQSTALDPNFFLMELLIMIDALRRASAKEIIAIMPYFGYCRQDRKDKPGMPITAKIIANMLSSAGISKLITIDLHAGQLEGFFEMPVYHLHSQKLMSSEALKLLGDHPFVTVAPDLGSVKFVEKMSKNFSSDAVVIEKTRISSDEVQMKLIGNVTSKHVLIIDDICSTAETLVKAACLCQEEGAEKIIAAVTHGIFSGSSLEKIQNSPIDSLLVTNTVADSGRFEKFPKISVLSVAPIITKAIQ